MESLSGGGGQGTVICIFSQFLVDALRTGLGPYFGDYRTICSRIFCGVRVRPLGMKNGV